MTSPSDLKQSKRYFKQRWRDAERRCETLQISLNRAEASIQDLAARLAATARENVQNGTATRRTTLNTPTSGSHK